MTGPHGLWHPGLVYFCGPAGVNAVDHAPKLRKTATGRGDVISFQSGFHGPTHAAMAVTGLIANKASFPLLGVRRLAPRGLVSSPSASAWPPGPGRAVDSHREIFRVVHGDNPMNPMGRNLSQSGCVPHRLESSPDAFLGPEGLPYRQFSALKLKLETRCGSVSAADERRSSCR
jgi:hypothetical protein